MLIYGNMSVYSGKHKGLYILYVSFGILYYQALDPENSESVSYRIVSGNPPGGAFIVGTTSGMLSLSRAVGFQETFEKRG